MKNKLIIGLIFLVQNAYSQSTAKQGWQKIGSTGTMSNFNSVLESDNKFSTGSLTLGSNIAPLINTKLKITGNVELDNSTATIGNIYKGGSLFLHNFGTSNTFIGINSGNLILTGNGNSGLGFNSLSNITTGSDNIAVGKNALLNNTAGNGNIAIGNNVLFSGIGGANIGIGLNSLSSTVFGNSNIGIGVRALANNTSAVNSIAIGTDALGFGSSANVNIGIGVRSLYNTIGNYNIALGVEASTLGINTSNTLAIGEHSLYNNLSSNNLGMGYYALGSSTSTTAGSFVTGTTYQILSIGSTNFTLIGAASNTVGLNFVATGAGTGTGQALAMITGGNNVAIGNNSLSKNTTGIRNTAIGVSALNNNTWGDDNLAIGQNSLVNSFSSRNLAIGTRGLELNNFGQENIAIGTLAGVNNYSGDNNIYIGVCAKSSITATSIVIGRVYEIRTIGTTNFTLYGAANNSIGTIFTATALGLGSGTVTELITGYSNIFIGDEAGNSNQQNKSAFNSIAIGRNVFTTTSNQVVLGDENITQTILSGVITKRTLDTAPATATSTGTLGEIRVTATHIYVCIATNQWVRTALTTF
jgi:hypothetical protein